jgi:hypothetical protein
MEELCRNDLVTPAFNGARARITPPARANSIHPRFAAAGPVPLTRKQPAAAPGTRSGRSGVFAASPEESETGKARQQQPCGGGERDFGIRPWQNLSPYIVDDGTEVDAVAWCRCERERRGSPICDERPRKRFPRDRPRIRWVRSVRFLMREVLGRSSSAYGQYLCSGRPAGISGEIEGEGIRLTNGRRKGLRYGPARTVPGKVNASAAVGRVP